MRWVSHLDVTCKAKENGGVDSVDHLFVGGRRVKLTMDDRYRSVFGAWRLGEMSSWKHGMVLLGNMDNMEVKSKIRSC